MANRTKAGDEENTGFGFGKHVAEHKPGVDMGSQEKEPETSGNHRFKRSDQKDIPKGTLAERFARKGG